MLAPISVIDLLFIDPAEELPLVLARMRLVISKLKNRLTQFCKANNLLLVIKMRDFYYNLLHKTKEIDLRTSMPMIVGIFMLQSLKKHLKRQGSWIKNLKLQHQLK